MKVKTELLQAFMQKNELSAAILAREMGVTVGEVEKLLSGKAVNEETARRFIYYFGADNAAKFIDWAAIGKQNPLANKNNGYPPNVENKKFKFGGINESRTIQAQKIGHNQVDNRVYAHSSVAIRRNGGNLYRYRKPK